MVFPSPASAQPASASAAAPASKVITAEAWVSAAFAIYLVDIGVLHGWIRRHQRRYAAVISEVETANLSTGVGPPDLTELEGLERRLALGWGVFNVLVVGAVYLMVFKPGS